MDGLVIAAQIYPGKLEAWHRLWQDLRGNRRQQFRRACRRHGVTRHQVCLMKTPRGHTAVFLLKIDQAQVTLSEFLSSTHPFDRWLKRQLEALHALSFPAYSPHTTIESVAEWEFKAT